MNNTLTIVYAVLAVLWALAAEQNMPSVASAGICAFMSVAFIGGAAAHAWVAKQ